MRYGRTARYWGFAAFETTRHYGTCVKHSHFDSRPRFALTLALSWIETLFQMKFNAPAIDQSMAWDYELLLLGAMSEASCRVGNLSRASLTDRDPDPGR